MDTSKHSGHRFPGKRLRLAAFSLVEVTLAIGIVAFAFVSVFGLIPIGLNTFREAMTDSVGLQITQRVLNEMQQTDFNLLTTGATAPLRYFDDQGNEVATTAEAVYQVKTRISPVTALPSSTGAAPDNDNIATVTVQVVSNPGNRAIQSDAATALWNDTTFSIATYSGFVARNQ